MSSRADDVLAQMEVAEGHRAAGPGHVIDVDPGLGRAEEREAVEQAGGGVPERPGAGVGGEERLGGPGVLGDDRRRQARGLGVGESARPRAARPTARSSPWPPCRRRAPTRGRAGAGGAAGWRGCRAARAPAATAGSTLVPGRLVDQQQVEAVADARAGRGCPPPAPAPAPGRRRGRCRAPRRPRRGRACGRRARPPRGASDDVVSPLPRRITSGIRRGSDTSARAASRSARAHQLDRAGSRPAVGQRGRDDLVAERDRRAERGRARAQHARVARLDQLRGDVDRHVGPRLVVGADHARPGAGARASRGRRGARASPPVPRCPASAASAAIWSLIRPSRSASSRSRSTSAGRERHPRRRRRRPRSRRARLGSSRRVARAIPLERVGDGRRVAGARPGWAARAALPARPTCHGRSRRPPAGAHQVTARAARRTTGRALREPASVCYFCPCCPRRRPP